MSSIGQNLASLLGNNTSLQDKLDELNGKLVGSQAQSESLGKIASLRAQIYAEIRDVESQMRSNEAKISAEEANSKKYSSFEDFISQLDDRNNSTSNSNSERNISNDKIDDEDDNNGLKFLNF